MTKKARTGSAKSIQDRAKRARQGSSRGVEESYRLLVDAITDYAIYRLDTQGRVSSWNAGAQRIKGYSPDEILGQHFSRFYTDEDRTGGEPVRALASATNEGRYTKEGWRVRKNGTRFWASVVIDPIWDGQGQLVGFAKITRDLTEREEAQRQLEMARASLFQSQKMEAIGQLTGGVAHDFNNLLMVTLGSLELLRRRLLDDPQSLRLLDNAIQGAQRGAVLTQRMLAFARRQELTLTRVELPGLVQGMAELIGRALGPSIDIDFRFALGLDAVTADANQLEMALLNLVVNARDAMPDGGLITIAARPQIVPPDAGHGLRAGRYVSLSVIDRGIGMDNETLTRAMEPFFTTKGVGKGTGLGLSMVHGLAEQSGGRFFIESEPGAGTTASLWLPVAHEEEVATQAAGSDECIVPTRPMTILAVDDDRLVLMNTVALLEDLGHSVLEAGSGEEALQLLRREPHVDLVITDQAMPNMTGREFIALAMAEHPGMRFMLATGFGEIPQDMGEKVPRLGKPFSQAELARAVAEVCAEVPS